MQSNPLETASPGIWEQTLVPSIFPAGEKSCLKSHDNYGILMVYYQIIVFLHVTVTDTPQPTPNDLPPVFYLLKSSTKQRQSDFDHFDPETMTTDMKQFHIVHNRIGLAKGSLKGWLQCSP